MQKVLGKEAVEPEQTPESQREPQAEYRLPPPPAPFKGKGLVIGIGIGVALTLGATKLFSPPQPAARAPVTAARASAQSITAATVSPTPVKRTLKATGTAAPFETISVLAQASGLQIRQLLIDEGDFVEAGQLIAVLDDASQQAQMLQAQAAVVQARSRLEELQAGNRTEEIARARESVRRIKAEIAQAQADLALAQKRKQRNQKLEAEGAIAQDRLDEILNDERNKQALLEQARARSGEAQQQLALLEAGPRREAIAQAAAQLAQAKAQLQAARTELDKTRILAPARGKVAKRNARIGQTTTSFSQTPLFEIIENNRLELRLKIPETQLSAIRPGQTVEIGSDADPRLKLLGKVREIDPTVDETSRQATVKVSLPPDSSLKPGMFLRGTVVTENATSLTVPMAAVLPQADGSTITYVLQPDGTVRARPVEIGDILPNQQVEIENGLQAGERIAVKGAAYLKDGARVSLPNLKSKI